MSYTAPRSAGNSKSWPAMIRQKPERSFRRAIFILLSVSSLAAADWEWNLPQGFARPAVPADNPMTAAKVEPGRYLYYDKRMSVNGKQSCGSCHKQELAFTDGRAR